jgi:hypothetical protein
VGNALDFHHIDGDPNNNAFENLLVLCSNHHRLATEGKIDKKACKLIKKRFITQNSQAYNLGTLMTQMKNIVRSELKEAALGGAGKKKVRKKSPSAFERKYLFRILRTLAFPPRDIYFSIRALGELKYKGSTGVIINAVEKLRKEITKRNKQRFYYDFYLPAVESLGKIGTKKAIKWMAREVLDDTQDVFNQFILLVNIAKNENLARRRVGFRLLSRASTRKGGKEIIENIYRICGKKLKILVEHKIEP